MNTPTSDRPIEDPVTPGYYQQAEALLRKQISSNPTEVEPRFKLLDLLFSIQHVQEFMSEAKAMHGLLDKQKHARSWQRVTSMARILGLNDSLFSNASDEAIEFVGETGGRLANSQGDKLQHRRFGDDDVSRPLFAALNKEWEQVCQDSSFLSELALELIPWANRPTPLVHLRRLSHRNRGAQIYIKRESLAQPMSQRNIVCLGQALLARRLKRSTLVTTTGDGRRGVVLAAIASRLGFKACIYVDQRHLGNNDEHSFRMRLLGAEVLSVDSSKLPQGDLRHAALAHWQRQPDQCFLVTGLEAAPNPYPDMNRQFLSTIGREVRRQVMQVAKRPPDLLVARSGEVADTVGFFDPFIGDAGTRLVCVGTESPADVSIADTSDPFDTRATLDSSKQGVIKRILGDLEQPSVMRELAWLQSCGRIEIASMPDPAAREAVLALARTEGLLIPHETAYALAWALKTAAGMKPEQVVVLMKAEKVQRESLELRKFLES